MLKLLTNNWQQNYHMYLENTEKINPKIGHIYPLLAKLRNFVRYLIFVIFEIHLIWNMTYGKFLFLSFMRSKNTLFEL